jgi:TatD DNase family protein
MSGFAQIIYRFIPMNTSAAFFDSHCHFDFTAFDADRSAVWQTCQQLGVQRLLIPGVAPAQWEVAEQMCNQYPGLCYAVGIHPWWIEQLELVDQTKQQQLVDLLHRTFTFAPKFCVAVGECGLDKTIVTSLDLQQNLLILQIELANHFRKPVIVHCVKAQNELIALCKHHRPRYGGVIHAFSGSYEMARQFVDLGFCLGIGGTITYGRAQKTRAAVKRLPLECLLLETDAPDMPLYGRQGARNSPEFIPLVAQALADLRGIALAEVAAVTWNSATQLFGIGTP